MAADQDLAALGKRITYAVDKIGGIKVAAKESGISASSLDRYMRGESEPPATRAARIAEVADIDLGWLVTGSGSPDFSLGFIPVPRYDVRLAAGDGAFLDRAQKLDDIPFTRELLRKKLGRASGEGLAVLEVAGDSMKPAIMEGDLVMADLRKTDVQDGIYAFALGDVLLVKRLRRLPDGIEVISDNKEYPPFTVPAVNQREVAKFMRGERGPLTFEERQLVDQFNVVGKIVWVGRMM